MRKQEEWPCYFLSEAGRCLGRPAETCPWAVSVGPWEWLCCAPEVLDATAGIPYREPWERE